MQGVEENKLFRDDLPWVLVGRSTSKIDWRGGGGGTESYSVLLRSSLLVLEMLLLFAAMKKSIALLQRVLGLGCSFLGSPFIFSLMSLI